ncbi:MAG: phosphoribosylglycinamide formyltransferase [Myxococcaceae bacterium]|nr:phosphoribosylglycinamide formyltransferase [Myxococcaceae bacterium]
MTRVGVLASGNGTNLQALIDALNREGSSVQVAVTICNVPGAKALARAQQAGVATELLPSKGVTDRTAYDAQLVGLLHKHRIDLVCLAGYMRLLTPGFLQAFPNQVLNIHPSLLPAFPGMHAIRQALEAGVKVTGCTVHFVDEGTDTGPIIAQTAVPVLDGDDENKLAERIHHQEHRLYPAVVSKLAAEPFSIQGRRVMTQGAF